MTKTNRLRDKLRTTLDVAAKARAADPLPNPAVERRFEAWFAAVRAVVGERLAVDSWRVEEWVHNPNCNNPHEFGFHYNGRETPFDHTKPLFVSTRMRFDASLDLEQELLRLEQEAKEYRECADMMYKYRQDQLTLDKSNEDA